MDQVPNTFPQLFFAYNVVWALLVLYIVFLGRRLKRVERSLKEHDKQ